MASGRGRTVLVVNPNTTQAITDALKPLVDQLGYRNTRFEYFTAPSGVASINDDGDAAVSAAHCLPALRRHLRACDAFLVCCYSQHPLVAQLRAALVESHPPPPLKPVTGIFECSIAAVLQTLDVDERFGIVSTGSQWSVILDEAVRRLLGAEASARYVGTRTTNLNADELHAAPREDVHRRVKAATRELVERGARAVCLGCAGMSGMASVVREACVERLGEGRGQRVRIIDGVIAGAAFLEGALRMAH